MSNAIAIFWRVHVGEIFDADLLTAGEVFNAEALIRGALQEEYLRNGGNLGEAIRRLHY